MFNILLQTPEHFFLLSGSRYQVVLLSMAGAVGQRTKIWSLYITPTECKPVKPVRVREGSALWFDSEEQAHSAALQSADRNHLEVMTSQNIILILAGSTFAPFDNRFFRRIWRGTHLKYSDENV